MIDIAVFPAWLGDMLVATSALMLAVLLLRRPMADLFGPRVAYAMWLIPAARAMMPVIETPALAETAVVGHAAVTVALDAGSIGLTAFEGLMALATAVAIPLWAVGALVFVVAQLLRHRRFVVQMLRSARVVGTHRGIAVILSPTAEGPFATGLLRRRIVLPADFTDRYDAIEQRQVLDHEAAHHRHGDLWANLAALLVMAMHWFNPLAWIAWRVFQRDQEACCDARVVGDAPAPERASYAAAVAKTALPHAWIPRTLTASMHSTNGLKDRLMMIVNMKSRSRALAASGLSLVALAALGGAVTTATTVPAALAQAEAPTPPVAPTPPPVPPAATPPTAPAPDAPQVRIIKTRKAPGEAGKAGEVSTQTRVIKLDRKGKGPLSDSEIYAIMAEQEALGGLSAAMARCGVGERVATEAETTVDGERRKVRVITCVKPEPGADPREATLRGLRGARDSMATNATLSDEMRPRILAAFDRKIAELEAANN